MHIFMLQDPRQVIHTDHHFARLILCICGKQLGIKTSLAAHLVPCKQVSQMARYGLFDRCMAGLWLAFVWLHSWRLTMTTCYVLGIVSWFYYTLEQKWAISDDICCVSFTRRWANSTASLSKQQADISISLYAHCMSCYARRHQPT
jgi:hypothetical protein